MKVDVYAAESVEDLLAQIGDQSFNFGSVHSNCDIEIDTLRASGCAAALHGATSCLGAMTHAGVTSGLAAFFIDDPLGAYATAARPFGSDAATASRDAVNDALRQIDRQGEKPDLIWVAATPGTEEAVLKGLQSVVGTDVPIIGGSAADNSVSGDWYVFDKNQALTDGLVVTVMFPSTSISDAYHNGYTPTDASGVVTKASGRQLLELDGRPAMEVYEEWTNSAVSYDKESVDAQAILSESTLWPFGREVSEVGGVPFHLLAHPATAHPSGAIDLFATVGEGERITLMNGTTKGLTERAGRVAALAKALGPLEAPPLAGALMIYCGGCMLSVRDALDQVVSGVNDALEGAHFLGAFTFGEQGTIVGAGNRHGNLMISCIIFYES